MKKVYVIFQDSDLKRLCWLKKGFRHCDIVFDSGISLEITFNEGFFVKQYDKNELFEKLKKQGIIIIEYEFKNGYYSVFGNKSCVGLCKNITGIKDFFILTPYQLYKKLLKNGGKHYG